MTARKFYATTFKLTVLSEAPLDHTDIESLAYQVTQGDCVGECAQASVGILNGVQAVAALNAVGSDATFFRLNADGSDADES